MKRAKRPDVFMIRRRLTAPVVDDAKDLVEDLMADLPPSWREGQRGEEWRAVFRRLPPRSWPRTDEAANTYEKLMWLRRLKRAGRIEMRLERILDAPEPRRRELALKLVGQLVSRIDALERKQDRELDYHLRMMPTAIRTAATRRTRLESVSAAREERKRKAEEKRARDLDSELGKEIARRLYRGESEARIAKALSNYRVDPVSRSQVRRYKRAILGRH